jgi:hypothetical protein
MLTTPQSEAFAAAFDEAEAGNSDTDAMFAEGETPELTGQEPELTGQATESGKPEAPQPTEEDLAERLWWDKCDTLAKIKACARMIEEVEAEVDEHQIAIKEAKEVLKGQQALLSRYSSQLADILDGHPLPVNPNAAEGPVISSGATGASDGGPGAAEDWRDYPTAKLLEGVKGMGPKKLEAIIEEAPTVGKLEDLRGQASMAHKSFQQVLPKGCGETMAEEIENRLESYIRDWTASQTTEDEGIDSNNSEDSDEYEDA